MQRGSKIPCKTMELNNIYHFDAVFSPFFDFSLDFLKSNTDLGDVFEEFNPKKEENELIYANFYQKNGENKISFKIDRFFFHFNILSGNLDTLIGEYKVEFMGKTGKITVTKLPMQQIGDIISRHIFINP